MASRASSVMGIMEPERARSRHDGAGLRSEGNVVVEVSDVDAWGPRSRCSIPVVREGVVRLADEGDDGAGSGEALGGVEDGDLGRQEELGVFGKEELDRECEEGLEEADGVGARARSPPSDWTMRARVSRSTILRLRRAARRRAAEASRSTSRRLPAAAS
jgi:hypothetical protein